MNNNWFDIIQLDNDTYIISENKHWEHTHCYLLIGTNKALLIDTGLGISNIYKVVSSLTDKPIIAIPTHVHWDHIGGLKYFKQFYVHEKELSWIKDKFPLPLNVVKNMVVKDCQLPQDFSIDDYNVFQGTPSGILKDNEIIDLGNRKIEVIHTPGHSLGHMCFYEANRKYLYSGDLIYKGILYANYDSTDPQDYLQSLLKINELEVDKLLPAHHDLNIKNCFIKEVTKQFLILNESNKLHHGSGRYDFNDWSLML